MILIDKKNSASHVLVTLTELAVGTTSSFFMSAFNTYTNITYTYGATLSTTSDRYDDVLIDLTNEDSDKIIETGDYSYTFYEHHNSSNYVVERGQLKVIDTRITPDGYVSIIPDETDDDFITYQTP